MYGKLKQVILTTALIMSLGVPVSSYALQSTDFTETQRQYEQTIGKRQALVQRLETLEDQYQGLVTRIDRVKSSGGMSTIAGRIELQNLLTKSKAIADELDAIQGQMRTLDNRIDGQRSMLVSGIDTRLRDLEKSLGGASPARRAQIVDELNSLRKRRSGFAEPIPSGPSAGEVRTALELAEQAGDHPDELMAAADELQDTEDQLRKRLAAIDAKLGELRNAKTLVRRARSFSREERFFEETDRDRVIARYNKEVTISSRGEEKAAGEEAEPANDFANNGAGGGGNNGSFEDDGAVLAGDAADADGFAGAPEARQDEPAVTDSPGQAEVANSGSAGSQDIFSTTRETIVIGGGSDPSRSVGSLGASDRDIDGQIRNLESEQKKLKSQADKLRQRARQLRDRADKQ